MDFQKIIAGMTGQQFMDAVNGNFDLSKEQINNVAANVLLRVIANNVKQLKVEDGKMYYTLDDSTWIPVDNNIWGSITGDLSNQKDLMIILNDKAPVSSVNEVKSGLESLRSDVTGVKTTVGTNTTKIEENTKAVGDLQKGISDKISSSDIVSFRLSSNGFLQYSLDGVAWLNVESLASMNWGSIGGEISNQIDLQEILNSKVKQSDFDSHTKDTNNPHQVDKTDVGLSEVDNTSDENKPISKPQKAEFDGIKELLDQLSNNKLNVTDEIKAIEYITLVDYNSKKEEGSLDDKVIYIVD